MSRPMPEPTNRTPTRVSCRIVSSTAAGPPSHAWLLAVLTTSNPARASAAAAAEGAVNTPTESGAALESGAIGLSRFQIGRASCRERVDVWEGGGGFDR